MMAGLTGCGGPSLSKNQRAEVESIAEDFADAASSDALANVDTSEIEGRLDQLETGEKRAIDTDKVELDSLQGHSSDIEELQTKLDRLIDHYNDHLNRFHGGG